MGLRDVPTFADCPDGRNNGFNLIRFLAATAVIISHSVPLVEGEQARLLLPFGIVPGRAAVLVFFAVSGYFISQSWDQSRSIGAYLTARALRILPALWVMLIFTLLLGLIIRTEPLADYLRHATDYVWHNMLIWPVRYEIGPLFAETPFGANVNRSLWTLRHEATCYLLVCAIGLLRLPARATSLLLVCLLAIASVVGDYKVANSQFQLEFLNFAFPFFVGAAIYHWRNLIPRSGWIVVGLFFLLGVTDQSSFAGLGQVLALSYGALWLGFRRLATMTAYNRFGDYSYGIYIYAFPIQQLMVQLGADRPLMNAVATFLATLPLAILSWHVVERPALRLKRAFHFSTDQDRRQ